MARIKINGNLTDSCTSQPGTHQGCFLRPSLFTICMEPMAQMIRESTDLTGIQRESETHYWIIRR